MATEENRFFSQKKPEDAASLQSEGKQGDSDQQIEGDGSAEQCLTLRFLQKILPCMKKKSVWEPSQGDVFKSHEVEETKYPRILKILENKIFDVIFVGSCLLSVFLFLFSEGFLMRSNELWGIIHAVNAIYTLGLFSQWLQILIKSKYSKTNQGYTRGDVIFTLLSIFPSDLIVLAVYNLNKDNDDDTEDRWIFTLSRINYVLRIRNILMYFSNWEDQLLIGDFKMFLLRTFLYTTFLIHLFACIWHRLACSSFTLKHFKMLPAEATSDVCSNASWMKTLVNNPNSPLLRHDWHVLITHYFVSVYWAINTAFLLGYGDINTYLFSDLEISFTAFTQITSWIFILSYVNGTLTSLLIESETERENFLTRRFAIKHYLLFTEVSQPIANNVRHFYEYLWKRSKGILNLDLIEAMPLTMKSEVFYDINRFVLDQLPLLLTLENSFLMSISLHMKHTFHLAGEILFKKNETGSQMFYIIKGYLEILSEDESHAIANIRAGSAIGEIFLLHPYPHVATVRCGNECDIMVLDKKDFKHVMHLYPEYMTTLQQRLEKRFEQSALLLALCEKHNEYPKAFSNLQDITVSVSHQTYHHSYENVSNVLDTTKPDELKFLHRNDDDFDGLKLPAPMLKKLQNADKNPSETKQADQNANTKLLQQIAYSALEADVARASSLSDDLGIPRPPLVITAPQSGNSNLSMTHGDTESIILKIVPQLKGEQRTWKVIIWQLFVNMCALVVVWYYPYKFAFREDSSIIIDYFFHIFDLIFAIDYIFDMIQIVVTPKKTLESVREIFLYRAKSWSFYIRLFGFLPIEYILAPMLGLGRGVSPYFYLLKFNRLLELSLIHKLLQEIESESRFPLIVVFMGRYGIRFFYLCHIFAVLYGFVLRDIITDEQTSKYLEDELRSHKTRKYEFTYYWAMQVITSTGYGDIPYRHDAEVAMIAIGVITGTCFLTFNAAKVASILANAERRRVSFKQTYYCIKTFMNQRHFPKSLKDRVSTYFKLQWNDHEGVLIPSDKSAIWDSPKTLREQVSMSQALQYIDRVPLIKHCAIEIQKEFCMALKQWCIPPGEIVQYPGDRSRELYIIVKGSCEVEYSNNIIGCLSEGRYFGLPGLIFGINKDYLIRTATHCQFFCLEFDDFSKITMSNPLFYKEYKILRGEASFTKARHLILDPAEFEIPVVGEPKFLQNLVAAAQFAASDASKLSRPKTKETFNFCRLLLIPKTIHPNSNFLKCWIFFRVFIAVLVTGFAPMQFCFAFNPFYVFILMLIFDGIAWVDIYMMLHVGYYGPQNQLITDKLRTACHYLQGSFTTDLLACFPFDLLILASHPYMKALSVNYSYFGEYSWVSVFRLNRMLQCYRLFVAGRLLEKTVFISLTLMTLFEVIPMMFLFINSLACWATMAVCSIPQDHGSMLKQTCDKTAWITHGKLYEHDIQDEVLKDPVRTYIVGLYWVTVSSLSVGMGDIELQDTKNRIIATTVIFLGVLVVALLGSKLTACMVGEDSRRIEIREKMQVMFQYLEQYKTSREARRRVRESYFSAWDKTRGISPTDLFAALHPTLKADVMKQLYENSLRRSPLFNNLDNPGIRMLCSKLSEVFYPEGEFLMKYGDMNDDVFIISSGVVVAYGVSGSIVNYMGAGSLLGEISALYDVQRLYTAVSATDVEMFVFKKDHFIDFLSMYPNLRSTLEKACLLHYKETIESSALEVGLNVTVPVTNDGEFNDDTLDMQTLEQRNKESNRAVIINLDDDDPSQEGPNEIVVHSGLSAVNAQTCDRHKMSIDILATAVTLTHEEVNLSNCIIDPIRVPIRNSDISHSPKESIQNYSAKWWSIFLTFGRIPLDEMGLIHIIQEKRNCNIINFAIHPASSICSWVSFFLLMTAVSCGLSAYEIAYSSVSGEADMILVVRVSIEIFFVIRILGSFHLAFYNENNVLIQSVKAISLRYICRVNGLFLDFLSTTPFYAFAYIQDDLNSKILAANLRGLQLFRTFLFVRYLNETETDLRMKASRVKILKVTILLCFIFHFCACAWYLVACYGLTCSTGSWISIVLKGLKDNGVIKDETEVSISSRYLYALYSVTNAITFTGIGEITPRTQVELFTTICIIFATVFLMGFLVGEMTQCLAAQVASKIHYQHELSVLEAHFSTLGLNTSKIAEVRNYLKLLWMRCRGMQYHNLMDDLPYPLRADIAFEIYGPNCKSSRIIGKLDENVIRQLCARIKHEIYMPGSHIVRAGDLCDAMYFIKKGEVVILDENTNLELCVETLYENECFGEVKVLLSREQYRFSYIARLESEVGVLFRKDIEDVLSKYPSLHEDLSERAERVKHHRITMKEEEDNRNRTFVNNSVDNVIDSRSHLSQSTKSATPSGAGMKRKSDVDETVEKLNFVDAGSQLTVLNFKDGTVSGSKLSLSDTKKKL